MTTISYVHKTVGDTNIVWLQKSNQYIGLKNPAFEIFELLAQNRSLESIFKVLQNKYSYSRETCQKLVGEMESQIAQINTASSREDESIEPPGADVLPAKPYATNSYRFNGKVFSISYETREIQDWLHPMLLHLMVEDTGLPHFHLHVFYDQQKLVFRETTDGDELSAATFYPADKILLHIANRLFDKTTDEWLMAVHASAISNGRKTMLFTAASGSGKTTLAALLVHKGYSLVADDLVLIDQQNRAFGFPSALSVKQGAVEVLQKIYPDLGRKEVVALTPEKQVRYLAADSFLPAAVVACPVHEVVFVNFNPGISFELNRLNCMEGIQSLLTQTEITQDAAHAAAFLDWAADAAFYRLSYSDSKAALDAISKIVENEQ